MPRLCGRDGGEYGGYQGRVFTHDSRECDGAKKIHLAMARDTKIDFGKTAADYSRYRAGFPEQFFERMFSAGLVRKGDRLLDLGTGTGTLARGFATRGCLVAALDPSCALLEQAKRLAGEAGLDDITYIEGRAEAIPFGDKSLDVVTAGQCWHWFDGTKAAAEVYRVLRDRGRIIVAHFDWISLPGNIVEATEALMGEHNPKRILAGSGLHGESLRVLAVAGFERIETASFDVEVPYNREAWRGRARAHGGIGGSLSANAVQAFDEALARLLEEKFLADPLQVPHRVWYAAAMKEEKKPGGPFANDDLDEEVRAADDTGMVAQQQEINAEDTLLSTDQSEDSEAP